MRQFRLCGASLAVAVIAAASIGAQVIGERPAAAQVPAFTIAPLAASFSINGDEKVPLSKLISIQPILANPQITAIVVIGQGGVRVDGAEAKQVVPTLAALLAETISATADGSFLVRIEAVANIPGQIVPSVTSSIGQAAIKFVPKATTTTSTTTTTTAPPPVQPPPVNATPPTPPTVAPTSPNPSTPIPSAAQPGAGNRAPVAQSTQLVATAGATTPLNLQASDPDGNPLTYVLVQLPSHGKLSGLAPALSYTPDGGFLGTDALVFTASDGKESSGQATVTITVTGGNAAGLGNNGVGVASKTVARKTVVRRVVVRRVVRRSAARKPASNRSSNH